MRFTFFLRLLSSVVLFPFVFSFELNAQTRDWLWARYATCHTNSGSAITTDKAGNVYVTGNYRHCDMFWVEKTYLRPSCYPQYGDVFILKYNASGKLLWANSAGGNGPCYSKGIAVDSSGNVYVTGYFTGTFMAPDRSGMNQMTNQGVCNLFVIKYDANGLTKWGFAASLLSNSQSNAISIQGDNNIYIAGSFSGQNSYIGNDLLVNSSAGFEDGFIARVKPNGDIYWAKSLGGIRTDRALAVSTDAAGKPCITGSFLSPALTIGTNTLNKSNLGITDLFCAGYDQSGNVLWTNSCGNNIGNVSGTGISTDVSGNTYLGGNFSGPLLSINSNTLNNTDITGSTSDMFVSKLDAGGNFIWARSLGSDQTDELTGVSSSGDVLIGGKYFGPSLAIGTQTFVITNPGYSDFFFARYDANGTIVGGETGGAFSYTGINAVNLDRLGNIHVTGFYADQYLLMADDTLLDYKAGPNMFVAKYGLVQKLPQDTVVNTVGIEDYRQNQFINVYPNPVENFLVIELKEEPITDVKTELTNTLGQTVFQSVSRTKKQEIDLSLLAKGIYFVRLTSDNLHLIYRVVRE